MFFFILSLNISFFVREGRNNWKLSNFLRNRVEKFLNYECIVLFCLLEFEFIYFICIKMIFIWIFNKFFYIDKRVIKSI